MTIMLPENVVSTGHPVENSGNNKQQIRQAVDVLKGDGRHRVTVVHCEEASFEAPADAPGKMTDRGLL